MITDEWGRGSLVWLSPYLVPLLLSDGSVAWFLAHDKPVREEESSESEEEEEDQETIRSSPTKALGQ